MKYHINKIPRKDDVTYYIALAIRNGSRVSTKNVERIGRRSELEAQGLDIEQFLKTKLDEYNNSVDKQILLKLDPNKKIKSGDTGIVNAGTIFAKRIFDSIKLASTLDEIQSKYQFHYSLSDVTFFLISQRILFPDSKIGMLFNAKKKALIEPTFSKDDIYRAMDILQDNRIELLKALYKNSPSGVARNKKVLYYDCTNTYFESEFEDNLRARGHGKRNEVEPLVSFGLLMDHTGIPVTYTTFKGSTNEQTTLIPLEEEVIGEFRQSELVIITDAGLSSKTNRAFNSIGNRKFITTLPVRKFSDDKIKLYIDDTEKEWTMNIDETKEEKLKVLKTKFSNIKEPQDIKAKYSTLLVNLSAAIENNNTKEINIINNEIYDLCKITLYRRYKVLQDKKPKEYKENKDDKYIEEDYLISYTLKYEIRQKKQRNKLIKKAETMLSNPGNITSHGTNDPKQYIEKDIVDPKTGEINQTDKTVYSLNYELIKEQEKLDGYYCVSTNLFEDDNKTIIEAMKYRWFIEDSFRIMKQNFEFRPVNHSLPERIKSHFLTCFLSLIVYRYIQKICHDSNYESLKNITDDNLLRFMKDYNLNKVKKDYYFPAFEMNNITKDMESIFNVSFSRECCTPAIINKEIKKQYK